MNGFLRAACIILPIFCILSKSWAQSTQIFVNSGNPVSYNFPGGACNYTWVNNTPGIGLPASGTGNIARFTAINNSNATVIATVTATPAPKEFAYIPNSSSSNVSVINLANNLVTTTIPVGNSPVGVSASPDGALVYIANQGSNSVSVISTASNSIVTTIPTGLGTEPSYLVVSPDGSQLYISNYANGTLSVVNTATNTIIKTIALGVYPSEMTISRDGNWVYVVNGGDNTISVVNTAGLYVASTIAVGTTPGGICVNPIGNTVYVANYNSNNISVISTFTNSVIKTIPVGQSPANIILSPDGTMMYVANVNNNTVSVISTLTNSLIATVNNVGDHPAGLSASPDGSKVYVAGINSNSVSIINTSTNLVTGTVTVGSAPISIGNFISGGTGCATVTLSITVSPSSAQTYINAGPAIGVISACVGSPSVSPLIQQISVLGNALTTDIIATAPSGFELSLTPNSGFTNNLTLTQTNGVVYSILFVRSAAADPIGNIAGNVVLTSVGALSQNVAVSGIINALPTANNVSNQTVANGSLTTAVNFTGNANLYNWVNNTPGIGLPASGEGNIAAFTALNTTNSAVTATITVTPSSPNIAYVANSGDGTVSAINLTTNSIITDIPVGQHPFGVSVSPNGNIVYVSNQNSNSVSVINTATNTVVTTITVGNGPQGLVVSPDGSRLYVTNSGDNTVSIINTATNAVISTIAVGLQPTGICVSPDGSRVYVTNYNDGTISVINTVTNAIVATIFIGNNPFGIAISPDGSQVYASSGTTYLYAISTASNTIITSILLDLSLRSVAAGICVSADGTRVYVSDRDYQLDVIYTPLLAVLNVIGVGGQPAGGISVSPDGTTVYETNTSNGVTGIDPINRSISYMGAGTTPISLGNFIKNGTNCSGSPITFQITVNPTQGITTGPVTGNISACDGSPSASPLVQQFTVSGVALTADIIAAAPPGFEISVTSGSSYSNSVTLTQTAGTVNNTALYVRSAVGDPPGNISGNVVLTSNGTASQIVAVSGTVNALPTVNPQTNQTVASGAATTATNFTGTGNIFSWINNTPGIGLAASGTGNIPAFTAINTGNTPVTANITVTSINKQAGYEYMTNGTTSQVSVISNVTNNIVATIDVGNGPYGIALSPDGSLAYVSNYNGNSVSVINTSANNVVATIPVGYGPIGITTSPDGSKIYVCCSSSVFIIDGLTNQVITSIGLPNSLLNGVTVSPDGKWLYVADPNNNTLWVINTLTYQQTGIDIPVNVPDAVFNVAVSPDGSLIYITGADSNNIYVISSSSLTIVKTINLTAPAIGIAVSPDGKKIYITNEFSNLVSVVDAVSGTLTTTIAVGNSPEGISVSPDGSTVYVANIGSNTMSIINTSNNQVTATVPAGATPHSLGNFVKSSISCTGPPITFSITVNAATANITTTGTLAPLTTVYGTPSASAKFTIAGTNMTAGILVTPPAGFEVSSDNITFNSTVTVGLAGAIASTTVYIRLTSTTPVGNNYSGNIVLGSTGAPNVNMAMPVSTVNPALLTITTNNQTKTYGGPNPALTMSYSGFVNGETQAVLQTPPNISTIATTSSPVGSYPITVNGAAAANYIVSFIAGGTLTITPASLVITANNVNKAYGATLTGNLNSTAFTAVGLQNSETAGSVTIAYGQGSSATDPTGTYTGSVIPSAATGGTFAAGNYTITYIAGDIVVGAASSPVIIASGTLLPLNTIYGTHSSAENFSVAGTNLVTTISVTPPIGFEVSTDNITFSNTVILVSAGNVASIKVYIRLASKTVVGFYSGNIVLSSGTTIFNVTIPNSMVTPAILNITANNKSKIAGSPNPVLTASYSGFVNNEGPTQLTIKPQIITLATTTSPAGSYPIIVSGAVSDNYTFNYVPGILTVTPFYTVIVIPNSFTPNNDGINDFWDIAGLIDYPQCTVSIFTRYGTLIYQSRGYPKSWDGTYKGSQLPMGAYYYVIDLKNSTAPLSGSLTLLR